MDGRNFKEIRKQMNYEQKKEINRGGYCRDKVERQTETQRHKKGRKKKDDRVERDTTEGYGKAKPILVTPYNRRQTQ